MSEDTHVLIEQARRDYGDLIVKIFTWPPGLGIDVHLIGGSVVQIHPTGDHYAVDQPSWRTQALRWIARLRGGARSLRRS